MEYIQTYFECFKASGINTTFEIHRMQGKNKIEAARFDHCTHDGVSAMVEFARKFPETGFKAPGLGLKPHPSISKRVLELVKWYARFWPFMPAKWKEKKCERQNHLSGTGSSGLESLSQYFR